MIAKNLFYVSFTINSAINSYQRTYSIPGKTSPHHDLTSTMLYCWNKAVNIILLLWKTPNMNFLSFRNKVNLDSSLYMTFFQSFIVQKRLSRDHFNQKRLFDSLI